jgi:hypothetical protein
MFKRQKNLIFWNGGSIQPLLLLLQEKSDTFPELMFTWTGIKKFKIPSRLLELL